MAQQIFSCVLQRRDLFFAIDDTQMSFLTNDLLLGGLNLALQIISSLWHYVLINW